MTDRQLIAHLLRRAGFGATPAEIDAYAALGFDATVDRLVDYEGVDNSALEAALAARRDDLSRLDGCQSWWLYRMLNTRRPLEEKMTLFWHGHFATTTEKVGRPPYMLMQNQLFRANALGGFADLVLKVTQDPAMLVFLDGRENVRSHPNENYARELMELFTLGIGNYGEGDVQEAARALTGWTIRDDRFFVDAPNHDSDAKTFLGQTGNFDGADICRIVVQQPACASFISRKLIRFFVTDTPGDDFVGRIATTMRGAGMSIRAAVRAILRSPEFRADAARRALIKSPIEFVTGSLKGLGADLPPGTTGWLDAMQQTLFNPPGVEGWVGGRTWMNTTTFVRRAAWVSNLVYGTTADGRPLTDVPSLFPDRGPGAAAAVVDAAVDRLLDGDMGADERRAVATWLDGATAQNRARRLLGVVHLVMTSPRYQAQ
jgi:uncharacterized protein (DUF1800 family)